MQSVAASQAKGLVQAIAATQAAAAAATESAAARAAAAATYQDELEARAARETQRFQEWLAKNKADLEARYKAREDERAKLAEAAACHRLPAA